MNFTTTVDRTDYAQGIAHGIQYVMQAQAELRCRKTLTTEHERTLALAAFVEQEVLPELDHEDFCLPRTFHHRFLVDEQGRVNVVPPEPLRFIPLSELLLEADALPAVPIHHGPAPSFEELADLEPRLLELLHEARSMIDMGGLSFCANRIWYDGFKPRLVALVGWERDAGPKLLRTSAAYDVAYQTIYGALPDCRDCACF